jgi:tetratricopeptide (TPR) repeat protein
LYICLTALFVPALVYAQTRNARLERGIGLYGSSRWTEAIAELRLARAEAESAEERAEALYWQSLAELSAGQYETSIKNLVELQKTDPLGRWAGELPYHLARNLYYLGRYDDAIVLLKTYSDTASDEGRKAAALYWIGESLYSMGRLEDAREIFTLVTGRYPRSVKFEAANYRIALINQKMIEAELLGLLRWSHEESLKTMEEYQRRERTYDQALTAYQKRIADLLQDQGKEELENVSAGLQRQLAEAREHIAGLEAQLGDAAVQDRKKRLEDLKNNVLELRNRILNSPADRGGAQ